MSPAANGGASMTFLDGVERQGLTLKMGDIFNWMTDETSIIPINLD